MHDKKMRRSRKLGSKKSSSQICTHTQLNVARCRKKMQTETGLFVPISQGAPRTCFFLARSRASQARIPHTPGIIVNSVEIAFTHANRFNATAVSQQEALGTHASCFSSRLLLSGLSISLSSKGDVLPWLMASSISTMALVSTALPLLPQFLTRMCLCSSSQQMFKITAAHC